MLVKIKDVVIDIACWFGCLLVMAGGIFVIASTFLSF